MEMPEGVMSATLSHCAALLKVAIRTPMQHTEWDDYVSMHETLRKITELQASYDVCRWSRHENIASFLHWLQENGVADVSSCIEFHDFGNSCHYGLRLKRSYERGDSVFELPKALVLSVSAILKKNKKKHSNLYRLFSQDSTLAAMPNMQLAVALLNERVEKSSFWTPYFDVLPTSYETPLFFNVEQMSALRGTTAFSDALNLCRSIARQYAYLFRLFHDERIPLRSRFTYEAYRWAVATVTTRQNRVHDDSLHAANELALIPLLDMCNHSPSASPCTDYDEERKLIRVLAHEDMQPGDELFIFYGARSNAEFLVHNGFVPSIASADGGQEAQSHNSVIANRFDSYKMQLGVAKADATFEAKRKLLAELKLPSVLLFAIGLKEKSASHSGEEHPTSSIGDARTHSFEAEIDALLLGFVRITCADGEQLAKLYAAATDTQQNRLAVWLRSSLNLFNLNQREEGEKESETDSTWWKLDQRAWQFLKARCELLIGALSRDRAVSNTPTSAAHCEDVAVRRNIRLLKIGEIQILSLVIQECETRLTAIEQLLKEKEVV